ncbi:MAG: HAMP domain-containing histidine kinase [Clostridiales bacterium]|nr:HAMP domain-containing histidine kinase [Clostridiales bacterium]
MKSTHSFGVKATAVFLMMLFSFFVFFGVWTTFGMVNDDYYSYGLILQDNLRKYHESLEEYGFNIYHSIITRLYPYRYAVPVIAAVLLLIVLALWVFLLSAAGRHSNRAEAVRNLQDRIPFDVYLLLVFFAAWFLFYLFDHIAFVAGASYADDLLHILLLALLMTAAAGGVFALSMTVATRIKTKTLFINTAIFVVLKGIWKVLCFVGRGILIFCRNLPILWKTVLLFLFYVFCVFLLSLGIRYSFFMLLAFMGINMTALILFIVLALQADKLRTGARRLAMGDFTHRIPTDYLWGEFKRHGENLNSIGSGMNRAVEDRIKSERLKTELITNVSHDIKTPLTSILNYVDLLKKEPQGSENAAEYLAVIDRQANRLKKMTEDVVEASKASTGNIRAELVPTDAAELLNQCLGEFGERFAAAKLAVVVQKPEMPLIITADGRLLSRVLDNLLGNISKYAQPETRVYASLFRNGADVVISLKNVSREALNVSEDELMERFVRGDSARTSEGSGLGLSIARSLTELQGGRFTIAIDCDLFNAELCFAAAEPQAGLPG